MFGSKSIILACILCVFLVSCNKHFDYIATDYHKIDLNGFKGKLFKQVDDEGFADLCKFNNMLVLKSECGSFVVISCSSDGSLFFSISDSLYFPKLFSEDTGFLYEFSSFILPIRSDLIDKNLESVFFIHEHWNYPEFSGILMVVSNDLGTSYFMMLNKFNNSNIEEKWKNAHAILNIITLETH